ncbi:protein-lysine methyltransferase METTL21E-like [Ambystoma mexicanum]|uniref:protein-lysine methyltransferase METTL21E-like n=1 Tax=Ambystoma mexicanum TaxID=8296 RepID=UPI0037E95310
METVPAHCSLQTELSGKQEPAALLENSKEQQIVADIMQRRFFPTLINNIPWEGFHFAGQAIQISEATDFYGATVWPSALVICHYLENLAKEQNLMDKNIIEIGAGTGLSSIVASLLGARVIATDLPDLLGNLQHNVSRNTKQKCKYTPQVKELTWGVDMEKNFPRFSLHFDYIIAADVVYCHPFLEELLMTFDHLCQDSTVILWAMKFRLDRENTFVDRFQTLFDLEVIYDLPSLHIKLYKAMRKNKACS